MDLKKCLNCGFIDEVLRYERGGEPTQACSGCKSLAYEKVNRLEVIENGINEKMKAEFASKIDEKLEEMDKKKA